MTTMQNICDNIWPIDYKDEEYQELHLRLTLKKLIFYVIFVCIITMVILGMIHPLTYTFTNNVRVQFLDVDFTSSGKKGPIRFKDIQDHADFWMYLHSVAIPNLYAPKWYSSYIPVANITNDDDDKFLYENSLFGVPRIREVKVKKEKCETYQQFTKFFNDCYYLYSPNNILKDNLDGLLKGKSGKTPEGPQKDTNGTVEDATSHPMEADVTVTNTNTTETENANNTSTNDTSISITYYKYTEPSSPYFHYGLVGTYDSGGYIQNLYKKLNQSLQVIQKLYSIWNVNRTTRALFLDFTFYNANLNLFCICKLTFEVPPTGGFITSSSFDTVKLIRYQEIWDFVLLGLELIIMFYIIFFIVQEVRNFIYYHCRYFTFYWTYINWFIIIGLILLIPFNTYKFLSIPATIKKVYKNPEKFADLEYIVYWQNQVRYLEGLLLFFVWIKIFRYLNIGKSTCVIGGTIKNASKDLLIFLTLFFIVFFGYAQMGYLLFGEHLDQFSSFGKALMTLLMTILGDFDYDAIEKTNKIFAPIYFVTYIILVFFLLFNMFIAIITDTFLYLKNEVKAKKGDLTLREFFGRFVKNAAVKFCPKYFKPEVRPWRFKGYDMIQNMQTILKLCNFTNLEIKLFFQKYHIPEDGLVDNELIDKMLIKVRTFKSKPEEKFLNSEEKLSLEFFLSQKEHLEHLQSQIKTAEEKLNTVAFNYRQKLKTGQKYTNEPNKKANDQSS